MFSIASIMGFTQGLLPHFAIEVGKRVMEDVQGKGVEKGLDEVGKLLFPDESWRNELMYFLLEGEFADRHPELAKWFDEMHTAMDRAEVYQLEKGSPRIHFKYGQEDAFTHTLSRYLDHLTPDNRSPEQRKDYPDVSARELESFMSPQQRENRLIAFRKLLKRMYDDVERGIHPSTTIAILEQDKAMQMLLRFVDELPGVDKATASAIDGFTARLQAHESPSIRKMCTSGGRSFTKLFRHNTLG